MKYFVSVIIPTYERQEYLRRTIYYLAKQTYKNFEIIIIDQSCSPSIKHVPRGVKYFHTKFKGVCKARNYGAKKAKGEILIFIDDDVIIPPSFIEHHIKNYRDPKIKCVAGGIIEYNKKSYLKDHILNRIWPVICTPIGSFNIRREGWTNIFGGGNFSVKKEEYWKVNGSDTIFDAGNSYFEDTDLAFRISKKIKIKFSPYCYVVHLRAPRGGHRQNSYNEYFWRVRNHTIFVLKNCPKVFFLSYILFIIAKMIIISVLLKKNILCSSLRGLIKGVKDWKKHKVS